MNRPYPAGAPQEPAPPYLAELQDTLLGAALEYAAAGLPVFPCRFDKKPFITDWPEKASTDPGQVLEWWRTWPEAMIGLVTGARSRLYVIDIDVKDGMSAYLALKVPRAEVAVRTPSGGGHAYFRWPGDGWGNTAGRIAPGIDTRGEGGYVIAPPSRTAAGDYWWRSEGMKECLLAGEVPELPERLRALLEPSAQDTSTTGRGEPSGHANRWAEAALRGEVGAVSSAPVGARNDTLNRAAFRLGQVSAAGHLEGGQVASELLATATTAGLGRKEAMATILSGFTADHRHPRGPSRGAPEAPAGDEGPLQPNLALLSTHREAPPPFPGKRVFGEAWGQWIADAAASACAAPDYAAVGLLGSAASAIGNALCCEVWPGWQEPAVFWGLIVGDPSARKSPALNAALAPLRAVETKVRLRAEEERARWELDGVGPEPHVPKLIVNDVTTEKLGDILARQPRGCLVFRDELAGWLGGMNQYKKGGGGDRGFWLEANGGRPYSADRLSRTARIPRLLVSVVGGIQPDRLNTLLMTHDDDGLLARFCPVWPNVPPVERPSRVLDKVMAERALLRLYALEMDKDTDGLPAPAVVKLSSESADRVQRYYQKVSDSEAQLSGLLKSFVGKTPGLVVRTAMLLAMLEWAAGQEDNPPADIGVEYVERALVLVDDHLVPMARRTYAEASRPADERAARTLGRAIVDQGLKTLTRDDIRTMALEGLRTTADIAAALQVLVDANILLESKLLTGGRPRSGYAVNPRVWS